MRYTKDWKDYELLDCSEGERLERWGNVILIRPDPQVIWNTPKEHPMWKKADARYLRSSAGGGHWEYKKELLEFWEIKYKDLSFKISPTGFKHTGLFPEQAVNWDMMIEKIKVAKAEGREVKVLNLFAYTGGATLAAAYAGASVCHVDAAKGMVHWARENAEISGLKEKTIRWMIDDCKKFVEREIRRGNKYDAVILDPPSYGRGPGGEVWKLEDHIYELIGLCAQVLSDNPIFVLLNSYTTGLSASTMAYVLGTNMKKFGGSVSAEEIGLPVTASGMVLPCGSSAIWTAEEKIDIRRAKMLDPKTYLESDKTYHIDMLSMLKNKECIILYSEKDGVMLKSGEKGYVAISAGTEEAMKKMLALLPSNDFGGVIRPFKFLPLLTEKCGKTEILPCYQIYYADKTLFDEPEIEGIEFKPLTEEYIPFVVKEYGDTEEYIRYRLKAGMIGAFNEKGECVGFIGTHGGDSVGMLKVLPEYRRRGIGKALEARMFNTKIKNGEIPFAHVVVGNYKSMELQGKMNMKISEKIVSWVWPAE